MFRGEYFRSHGIQDAIHDVTDETVRAIPTQEGFGRTRCGGSQNENAGENYKQCY